ncbi:acyl-CoA dehydrogenase family protein, partial [Thermodesulfobacteriota bacterium]
MIGNEPITIVQTNQHGAGSWTSTSTNRSGRRKRRRGGSPCARSSRSSASRFPGELIRAMGREGLFGCALPPEQGGSGLGFLAHALVCEEISRAWSSLRSFFNSQALTVPLTILKHGTGEQKEKYVRPLVTAEEIGLIAITEPDAGSDVAGIRTTARKRGGYYVLNGRKTWISHAPVFDCGIVLVKTDPSKRHDGISIVIVEPSDPGLSVRSIEDKLGHMADPIGEVVFEDCEIPTDRLVGPENGGFAIIMEALDHGRLSVAAGAVGVAQACMDCSVSYARSREQFGQPIGRFQMVQKMIADMACEVKAARLLTHHCDD